MAYTLKDDCNIISVYFYSLLSARLHFTDDIICMNYIQNIIVC